MAGLAKKALRQKWRSQFSYTPEQKAKLSAEICRHLLNDPRLLQAKQIGLFAALPWEPEVTSLLSLGKAVFPKADGKAMTLAFYKVKALADLQPGFAGILEPKPSLAAADDWSRTDVLLIPGYGFDIFGARVGSGKGFYDRFLPKFAGIRIGVAFEAQISQLPLDQEPFDARMAGLCTETGMRNVMP